MTSRPDEPAWVEVVRNEEAVAVLAAKFAVSVETPVVIYLRGDLGAGKTTFARAYIQSFCTLISTALKTRRSLNTWRCATFSMMNPC